MSLSDEVVALESYLRALLCAAFLVPLRLDQASLVRLPPGAPLGVPSPDSGDNRARLTIRIRSQRTPLACVQLHLITSQSTPCPIVVAMIVRIKGLACASPRTSLLVGLNNGAREPLVGTGTKLLDAPGGSGFILHPSTFILGFTTGSRRGPRARESLHRSCPGSRT